MRQRGVALISALLVVALATTAAVKLTTDLQLDLRRSANLITRDQAWEYLLGGEQFVMYLLRQAIENKKLYELLGQERSLPIDGGFITGQVSDLEARFNLNNLLTGQKGQTNDLAYDQLRTLLEQLSIKPGFADAIRDWVDADSTPFSAEGAEEGYYLGLEHPYRPANRPMESPSELVLVRGYTDIEEKKRPDLRNEITTLPPGSKINVNSASESILRALGFDAEAVATILDRRQQGGKGPYESLQQLQELKQIKQQELSTEGLDVTTHHFLLTASAQIGRSRLRLYSIIRRTQNGGFEVIARSLGTL